jgi:hypothetical protein
MEASEFIEDAQKKEQLDFQAPDISLTLQKKNGESLYIKGIIKEEEKFYVSLNNKDLPVYGLGRYEYDSLNKKTEDFIDKNLFKFESDDIMEVKINKFIKGEWVIKRTDQKWELVSPEKIDKIDMQATNILNSLEYLRYIKVLEFEDKNLSLYGLEPPQIEVTLLKKDKTELKLIVGDKTSEGVYCSRGEGGFVGIVSEELLNDLDVNFHSMDIKEK